MVDLETLELNYFVNMDNVPYELKDGGLIYIKPILVKDYSRYSWAKEILSIEKNEINDIERFVIPIGQPMANCKAYILSKDENIQPLNTPR